MKSPRDHPKGECRSAQPEGSRVPAWLAWGARGAAALVLAASSGCVSVGIGGDVAAHAQLALHDASATPVVALAAPIVPALLVQPQPAGALADTQAIAYSRRAHEFAFYQLASWTERPVRQLPRLLQRRLEARGLAGAVGLLGEPLRADWLLSLGIDTLHHDVAAPPGSGRVAITVDLFDRRTRARVARRSFEASMPAAEANSAAAAQAMSQAVARVFDELLPWLEAELRRAARSPV
ncbi:MAG: membrane integrity-associated transporter subunit PqiC [Burkholderiales bacterium]|nr:membrane integrity-associated transporter subunit PqiC [Burkholderiales bacterium]